MNKHNRHQAYVAESLIRTLVPNESFTLSAENRNLIITGSEEVVERVAGTLAQALQSSDAFLAKFHYQKQADPDKKVFIYQVEAPKTVSQAKAKVINLLGHEAFSEAGLSIDTLFDDSALFKEGVLFSKPTTKPKTMRAWQENADEFASYFDTDIDKIRDAYHGKGRLLPSNENLDTPENHFSKTLFEPCFSVQTQRTATGTQAVLMFNAHRMHYLLTPPLLNRDSTVQLSIPISHLVLYAQQLARETPLIRLYQSPDVVDGFEGRPILLGNAENEASDIQVKLVVDCSASMMDHDYYKQRAEAVKFLELAHQNYPTIKLDAMFFGYAITDSPVEAGFDFSALRNFVATKDIEAATALFGALMQDLNQIESEAASVKQSGVKFQKHSARILLSDGEDTMGGHTEDDVLAKVATLNNQKISVRYYPMGIGTQAPHNFLNRLASSTNSYYQRLSSEAFEELLKNLPKMTAKKIDTRWIIKQLVGDVSYVVPIYGNGEIQETDITISGKKGESVTVVVDGKELVVSPDVSKLPKASAVDRLKKLEAAARKVIANTHLRDDDKEAELSGIMSHIKVLYNSAEKYQQDYFMDAYKYVEAILVDFKRSRDVSDLRIALENRLMDEQGYRHASSYIPADPKEQSQTNAASKKYDNQLLRFFISKSAVQEKPVFLSQAIVADLNVTSVASYFMFSVLLKNMVGSISQWWNQPTEKESEVDEEAVYAQKYPSCPFVKIYLAVDELDSDQDVDRQMQVRVKYYLDDAQRDLLVKLHTSRIKALEHIENAFKFMKVEFLEMAMKTQFLSNEFRVLPRGIKGVLLDFAEVAYEHSQDFVSEKALTMALR